MSGKQNYQYDIVFIHLIMENVSEQPEQCYMISDRCYITEKC